MLAQSTISICRRTCDQVSGDIVVTFVPALYLLRFQSDKTRLSSGVVNRSLDGDDISTLPMYRRGRLGIGYLPQEMSIFRGLNVQENIMAILDICHERGKGKK